MLYMHSRDQDAKLTLRHGHDDVKLAHDAHPVRDEVGAVDLVLVDQHHGLVVAVHGCGDDVTVGSRSEYVGYRMLVGCRAVRGGREG